MRRWFIVGVWSVPAALTTFQFYLLDSPEVGGGSLARAALREALPWIVWVVATPVILRAAERGDVRRRLVRHVLAVAGIAIAFGALVALLGRLARPTPPSMTLGADLEMEILDWLPIQPLLYAGVLATGFALAAARRRRSEELARARLETELTAARLAALRAQIHPHFLFNTLNAAVALARAGDGDACAKVLVLLGELLHELVREAAPQEIPLREEVRWIGLYLEIQRIRFGDRVQIGWAIDDTVRDALVPQLILQPLVENAFRHGISQQTLSGKLDIAATRTGDLLEIVVHDDGPGPTQPVTLGVGLRNTGERLKQLYGERGTVRLSPGHRGGAVAAVTLPLRLEPTCAP